MQDREILISGASVGGPILAYWLRRFDFRPTVVERAPALRRGGQAVDIRGAALDVIERMGLLDAARAARTGMRGMSVVDAAGNEVFRTTEETLTGGRIDSPDIELLRDDLAAMLHDATRADVPHLFDDSIASLEEDDGGVAVSFTNAPRRRFDLVVGADGLHSNVRRLAFGEPARFLRAFDIYLAVFTAPNTLGLDHWQVFQHGPKETVGMYSVRNDTEVRVILGFQSDPIDVDHRDVDGQMRLLERHFADSGWETPRLLIAMRDAPDFHFDVMAQVHMDRWTNGRVALVGDAGHCSSPLSGQGTSLAIVGAYVLAGELALASGDHAAAFAAYETRMRPFVEANQALAVADRKAPPEPEVLQHAARAIDLPDYEALISRSSAA